MRVLPVASFGGKPALHPIHHSGEAPAKKAKRLMDLSTSPFLKRYTCWLGNTPKDLCQNGVLHQ